MIEMTRTDEFNDYGEHWTGNLLVVDYMDHVKNQPDFGQPNALTFDKGREEAERQVKEKFGTKYERLLAIPVLVIRLP